MEEILKLAGNYNFVKSIVFKDDLEINIETWDGKAMKIVCRGCEKSALNVGVGFEIGEIFFTKFSDLSDDREMGSAKEDPECSSYSQMMICDPWAASKESEAVFMRVIAEKYILVGEDQIQK